MLIKAMLLEIDQVKCKELDNLQDIMNGKQTLNSIDKDYLGVEKILPD